MTITSGLQTSPGDCWSRSYQKGKLGCLRSDSVFLIIVLIGNYIWLQQWIYEFCYQLGMHLKFRNRRRILNGPELIARESDEQQACTVYVNVARKANPKVGPARDQFRVGLRICILVMMPEVTSTQSLSFPAA